MPSLTESDVFEQISAMCKFIPNFVFIILSNIILSSCDLTLLASPNLNSTQLLLPDDGESNPLNLLLKLYLLIVYSLY